MPIRRILVVIIAFVLTCAAASIVFIVSIASAALFPSFLWSPPALSSYSELLKDGMTLLFESFVILLLAAFLPSFAVVMFAEVRQLRSWTYYSAWAFLIGIWCNIVWVCIDGLGGPSFANIVDNILWVLIPYSAFAGAVAGLCYWWIAGRNAGNWRDANPIDNIPHQA